MKLFNKKESKYSLSSHGNKLLFFYLTMPLVLGILLGDGLGIDISQTAAKHVGLLRFIQIAGFDIVCKSLIFMIYLLFSPCIMYYYFNYGKINARHPDPLKTASASRLLILSLGAVFMAFLFYALFFIGPHESYIAKPDRKIRFLFTLSRWDISFAIFVAGMFLGGMAFIYAPILFINEILLRLKIRTRRIGRSK